MTLSKTLVAAGAITLLTGTPQAHAHRRGGGGHSRGGSGGGHGAAAPRVSAPRSVGAPRAAVPVYNAPRVIGPRIVGVAPVRFYRPCYTFRPRRSLGFGLWGGYQGRET